MRVSLQRCQCACLNKQPLSVAFLEEVSQDEDSVHGRAGTQTGSHGEPCRCRWVGGDQNREAAGKCTEEVNLTAYGEGGSHGIKDTGWVLWVLLGRWFLNSQEQSDFTLIPFVSPG